MASYCGAYYDGVLRVICAGRPPVVQIAGEIDEVSRSGLVSTLEGLTDHEGDVHVNLAEVAFCDLAGLRAILRLAENNRGEGRNGRRLILHDVPLHLAAVLGILGWDSTPGLIMNEPGQQTASPSGMVSGSPAFSGAAIASTASVNATGFG
jgi:anti-anti-sigma regulatory factor